MAKKKGRKHVKKKAIKKGKFTANVSAASKRRIKRLPSVRGRARKSNIRRVSTQQKRGKRIQPRVARTARTVGIARLERGRRKSAATIGRRVPTARRWLQAIPEQNRRQVLANLAAGVKTLRKLDRKYDAVDLRKLDRMTAAQFKALQTKVSETRGELSRPSVLVRPRTARSRQALSVHTGKRVTKRQRAVIVHTDGRDTKIRLRRGMVETVRESVNADGTKHIAVQRDHYFLFARKPKTWRGVMQQARRTLADMPPGMYMLVSSNHGLISLPTERDALLSTLEHWFMEGGSGRDEFDRLKAGFAETIIGFRWVGVNHKQSDAFIRRYRDNLAERRKAVANRAKREKALIRRRLKRR